MPTQIVLAWDIDVANSVFGPAAASTAFAAVELYQSTSNDPVLGQFFGLGVAGDAMSNPTASTVRRTLTLAMAGATGATFPCHPRTAVPPTPPYPLRRNVTLPGSFFVTNGSATVATTASQIPSLTTNDTVQFLSQPGVYYAVIGVGATTITLGAPYTAETTNTGAYREVATPVTRAAVYSSSPLDTDGVATTPAIPAGPGARTVIVSYKDSTGAGPFAVTINLTGKRPAALVLDGGSIDIAEIENISVASSGSFGDSVGQITLCELSEDLPPIPPGATPGTGIGAGQGDRTFFVLTDEAQMLIVQSLAYIPPSYFALSRPESPALAADFTVTTGSKDVPVSEDLTGVLTAGNLLEFAAQPGTLYTIDAISPKIVKLTAAYTGIDDNFTGADNVNSNAGTKGNLGTTVTMKKTGASSPSVTFTPSNDELSVLLGQFVALEVAAPPPNPPLDPATVPAPVFLSGLYTRTLQLALAGTPIVPQPITFV